MSCLMTKTTKWHVHPAKTQISLGIMRTARTNQTLHWDHMSFCWFCHEAAQMCPSHESLHSSGHGRQQVDRVKRIWYLSPMRAVKVQASLRIRTVFPEPSLLAHTSSESRGTFRQKARSLAPLNGWACAVKICHDGMLEDTNSLDGAQVILMH